MTRTHAKLPLRFSELRLGLLGVRGLLAVDQLGRQLPVLFLGPRRREVGTREEPGFERPKQGARSVGEAHNGEVRRQTANGKRLLEPPQKEIVVWWSCLVFLQHPKKRGIRKIRFGLPLKPTKERDPLRSPALVFPELRYWIHSWRVFLAAASEAQTGGGGRFFFGPWCQMTCSWGIKTAGLTH